MIFPFFLLVAIAVFYVQMKQKPMANSVKFPDDLQSLCPHTNFCDINPLEPLNNSYSDDHVVYSPCCKPCFCDGNCGLRRDCCADSFDHYRLDRTLQPACKALNTKSFNNRDEQLYYVIDKCPKQVKNDNDQSGVGIVDKKKLSDCAKRHSHGYLPVYSESDGRIYHNEECAFCHNQSQLQSFIPTLKCSDVRNSFTKIMASVLNGKSDDLDCFLQFLVPSHIDISSEKCHRNIIRECQNHSPEGAELQRRCLSFNASFDDSSKRYGNVYCYLCSARPTPEKETLLKYNRICVDNNYRRFYEDASFAVLLPDGMIGEIKKVLEEPSHFSEIEKVCFESVKKIRVCRVIYCPEGHFRLGRSCSTFGQTWYLHNLQIYIKLTPIGFPMLTKSDVHQIIKDRFLNKDKSQIRRHGFQHWAINLFYNIRENSTTAQYFIAVVSLKRKFINSKTLLRVIDNSLKSEWNIGYRGLKYKFQAKFDRITKYYERKSPNSFLIYPFMINLEHNSTSLDESLALRNVTEPFEKGYLINRFLITKMFFCRQIELKSEEFREELDRIFLFKQTKYLLSGEYIVSEYTDGVINAVRVCLDDILQNDLMFEINCSIEFLSARHFTVNFTILSLAIHMAVKLL